MSKKSRISARVDEDVKREAEQIFDRLGLSTSSAISLFLNQVVTEVGFPFRPRIKVNEKTRRAMEKSRAGEVEVFEEEGEMFEELEMD
jgi:DNA-damage-inducible protein J